MLFTFLTIVTRRSRSASNFYPLIGQNLTGKFMRKIYTACWNLFTLTIEADRVLCQLVVLLTVFFHWMYKMKCSCYQESSVAIAALFIEFLVGKCFACQSRNFGWHRFRFCQFRFLFFAFSVLLANTQRKWTKTIGGRETPIVRK